MKIQDYENQALQTDQTQKSKSTDLPFLGLFGEVGSLTSEIKKKQRDTRSYVGYQETVIEELGDVLWYLTILAHHAGIPLIEISGAMGGGDFLDLQAQHALPLQHPTTEFEKTLLALGASTGTLLSAHLNGTGSEEVRACLTKIFAVLVTAANEAHVRLDDAAQANLKKIFDRWPKAKTYPPLFDTKYPTEEQLPRILTVDISEREVGGRIYVIQKCNDILIGDRVTDNIMAEDDYRFHDVFHYAYAAILGWSPVTRSLFRLKRRSDPKVDHAEDGARATLIEEGVSTFIFGHAKILDFFEGQKAGDLSFTLLKTIRDFARGFEPSACPLWLWEEAILKGYEAFRYVKRERKVRLSLELASDRRVFNFGPQKD